MNPEHLALTEKELAELRAQGIIEPINSQWAYQPFYINNIAKQV